MDIEAARNQLEQDAKALERANVQERLKMTPEERIEAHENARQLIDDLQKAGQGLNAKSKKPSQTTD